MGATWVLAIHGGAGLIRRDVLSEERATACETALREALRLGGDVLAGGGAALDAVETAVVFLEDDPLFNAGRGAVFTSEGELEHEEMIVDACAMQLAMNPALLDARDYGMRTRPRCELATPMEI